MSVVRSSQHGALFAGIRALKHALYLALCLFAALLQHRAYAVDTVIRPAPAPGPLDNPLKGWCPYTNVLDIKQPYSMVFVYVPWKDIEPREGDFRFSDWERRAWNVPHAFGKHIIFRVYIDYPGLPSGMPDWLKAAGVHMTHYTERRGGDSPDYDDPRMVAAMRRLISALGKRYDGDPRVAYVEFGLLGFWGEWHTFPLTKLFASPATQRIVLQAAQRAFPHKIVMTRVPLNYAGTQPDLGFFDDSFPKDTEGESWMFLPSLQKAGRDENWKRATIGGEMLPGTASTSLGSDFATTLQRAKDAHFTWIGPYGPESDEQPGAEFEKNCETLVRAMGYEYRLDEIHVPTQIRSNDLLRMLIVGTNTGCAPFYYPWEVRLALLDDTGRVKWSIKLHDDIRTWQPGPIKVEASALISAPPGSYRLALGIIDPWTGAPSIYFANDLPRVGGWTVLSTLSVEQPKP